MVKGVILVLLLALVIIGILYIGKGKDNESSPMEMVKQIEKAKFIDMGSKVREISQAINAYYMDHGEYPEILDLLVPNYIRLPQSLKDPWGTALKLDKDSELNMVLVSAGKDKTFGSSDDIKRSLR